MNKEEMPDDGISYYCDYDGSIYTEKELNLIKYNKLNNKKYGKHSI